MLPNVNVSPTHYILSLEAKMLCTEFFSSLHECDRGYKLVLSSSIFVMFSGSLSPAFWINIFLYFSIELDTIDHYVFELLFWQTWDVFISLHAQ